MKNRKLNEKLNQYKKETEKWFSFVKSKKAEIAFNKEENTMVKCIIHLLEILGWNIKSEDVEFEYYVRKKNMKKGRFVDVALFLYSENSKIPKILIEVKPVQNDKLDSAAMQMFQYYLRHTKVRYGIVTNGRRLILFDKFRTTYKAKKSRPLFEFESLQQFINYSEVLNILSRDMVKKGILDRFVKVYHSKKLYWDKLQESKKNNPKFNENTFRLNFAREVIGRLSKEPSVRGSKS